MKSLDDNESARLSKPTGMDGENGESRSGVIGNERLTALAGAVLLVLILLELVSSANLHALLPLHIFVGVFLAGPLVVKLGSTGYRFVRYYTKSPAYVRSGPPRLPLRCSPHCCLSRPSRSWAAGSDSWWLARRRLASSGPYIASVSCSGSR